MASIQTIELKKRLRRILYGRTLGTTYINDFLLIVNIAAIFLSIAAIFIKTGPVFSYIEFGFGVFFCSRILSAIMGIQTETGVCFSTGERARYS